MFECTSKTFFSSTLRLANSNVHLTGGARFSSSWTNSKNESASFCDSSHKELYSSSDRHTTCVASFVFKANDSVTFVHPNAFMRLESARISS